MSIPKGLIIYRANRHQEPYPANLKCRYYSNKLILFPTPPKTTKERTQTTKMAKLIQFFHLRFDADDLEETQISQYFSKFHRIQKFSITLSPGSSEDLAINLLKKSFRTLKSLQQVKLDKLRPLQKDSKTFKNLLLQRSLKKLIVDSLDFYKDGTSLTSFLKLSQGAERRKCWPHFESLGINLEYSGRIENSSGSLGNLLQFLLDFKQCHTLYNCSHFQLTLPISEKESAVFDEILKLSPPFIAISPRIEDHVKSLFSMTQYSKELKCLNVQFLNVKLPDSLEMDALTKFPNLQEVSLSLDRVNRFDDESPKADFSHLALKQMGSMVNLRSVSLDISGDPGDFLPKALSKFTELRRLKLRFSMMFPLEDDFSDGDEEEEDQKLNWPWLKQVFQAIGKMNKLKELILDFETFSFKKPGPLFKSLCQALGKLTQLTSLHLQISDGESVKDKNILDLASCLNRFPMLDSLLLRFDCTLFNPNTFVQLMEAIMTNSKIISRLNLQIHCSSVTKQCHEIIYQGIRQMKGLNYMKIEIGVKMGKGELLDAEVDKRMAGEICAPGYY